MSAAYSWFTLLWVYLQPVMAICVILQKGGGPDSWKTSNGSTSDYPLIIITSLYPCWWLLRKRLGKLIDHNKMNKMGQLWSQTQTRLWKCIRFYLHLTFRIGNFKTNWKCMYEWAQSMFLNAHLGRAGDDRSHVIPTVWFCPGTEAGTCQNMRPVFH